MDIIFLSFIIPYSIFIIEIILIIKKYKPFLIKFDLIKKFLFYGIPILLASLSSSSIVQFTTVFIGLFSNLNEVAIFYVAKTFIGVILIYRPLYDSVFSIILYQLNSKDKNSFNVYKNTFLIYTLIILFITGLILILTIKDISVLLFGQNYVNINEYGIVLVITYITQLMLLYPSLDLEVTNKTYFLLISAVFTLIITFIAFPILIIFWGTFGVSLGLIFSSIINIIAVFYITYTIASPYYNWIKISTLI